MSSGRAIILFLDKMVRKPFYRRINILHRLRRKKQYYTAFRGGLAAMPLISGIIKRSIRFIRNKYKTRASAMCGLASLTDTFERRHNLF